MNFLTLNFLNKWNDSLNRLPLNRYRYENDRAVRISGDSRSTRLGAFARNEPVVSSLTAKAFLERCCIGQRLN